MLEPSINTIKEKTDSRYTLVILAAKRARDIIDGKPMLLDMDIDKPVSVASHEIAEDLITYKREEI
ncbi:MAG: DNA-directed RNA polymerase subunit omega [Anaerovoracaceae bacterium]|jgi:DNA-directed RNA polymerase subunit omega